MKTGLAVGFVVTAGLAFAAGRLSAASPVEPPATPDAATVAESDAPTDRERVRDHVDESRPLALLRQCAERLEHTRARLRAGHGRDSEAIACGVAECLERAEVRAACAAVACPGSSPTGGDAVPVDEAPPGSPGAAQSGQQFARQFATSVVGTSPQDAEWLEEYLCTVHGLREGMVAELRSLLDRAAPTEEIEAAIASGQDERAAVLEDLEQRLGSDDYQRLRSVGGLGILGSALECPPTE